MGCYYIMGTEFRFAGGSKHYEWTVVVIPTMGMYYQTICLKWLRQPICLGCFIIIIPNHYIFDH